MLEEGDQKEEELPIKINENLGDQLLLTLPKVFQKVHKIIFILTIKAQN